MSGITLLGFCLALYGFGQNVYNLQGPVCSARFLQPHLSDFCGNHGWGNKPTHEERIAWEKLPPGSCEALTDYVTRFGNSPLNARAEEWYSLRRTVRDEIDTDYIRLLETYVRQAEKPAGTKRRAEEAIRVAAFKDAGIQCRWSNHFERLVSSQITDVEPECREVEGVGHFCGGRYKATCHMRGKREREWCGPKSKEHQLAKSKG